MRIDGLRREHVIAARRCRANAAAPRARRTRSCRSAGQVLALLEASAAGDELTAYHLEAAIAAVHASATSVADTDWPQIVALYDRLLAIAPSPVVELNRAIAIGRADGPARGLEALHAIGDHERLASYPFYPAAIGELELQLGRRGAARARFEAAIGLARNHVERQFLIKRVRACD